MVKRPRPKRVLVAAAPPAPPRHYAESSFAQRTLPVYLLRPVSCDEKPPAVIQALLPAEEKPPAQVLLDELAGPAVAPPTPEAPPAVPSEFVEEGGPPGIFFPGGGGVPGGGGGVFPGGGQPPVTPPGGGQPPVTPPDQPPVGPPDVGQPPIVPPVPPNTGQPPVTPPGPPPILPPDTGPPPILPPDTGPPPGVPEPATWAMLIAGFFGLGEVLRRDHASRRQVLAAVKRETLR